MVGCISPPLRRHVCVTIYAEGVPIRSRVLDMRTDYGPLMKEMAYRAVACDRRNAGLAWDMNAAEDVSSGTPCVVLEVRKAAETTESSTTLAAMRVSATNFGWLAAAMAEEAGVVGEWDYRVTTPAPGAEVVLSHEAADADGDFEVVSQLHARLRLPKGFRTGQPVPKGRRVVPQDDRWLVCIFTIEALRTFLEAASREHEAERSWAGMGFVHVGRDACRVVIERIIEIPGEAGRTWIATRGRQWARLHSQIGAERLVGYLHLHPRLLDDREVPPAPSANDAVVAWNIDLASVNPCVFPIANFGADPRPGAVAQFNPQRAG